jgi:hypothetical protein
MRSRLRAAAQRLYSPPVQRPVRSIGAMPVHGGTAAGPLGPLMPLMRGSQALFYAARGGAAARGGSSIPRGIAGGHSVRAGVIGSAPRKAATGALTGTNPQLRAAALRRLMADPRLRSPN